MSKYNKEFWNERYNQPDFVYGEKPNLYLESQLRKLPTGEILFPAEGEGRNSVFSAELGWKSVAFDQSEEAKKKAEKLAETKNVKVHYNVSTMENIDYPENNFDAIALVFAHFNIEDRKKYHQKLASLLKKGGTLIIEGFSKDHQYFQEINPKIGGPKNPEMLYDLETLKSDFEDFNFIEAYQSEIELNEGLFHIGKASVVRILATKK